MAKLPKDKIHEIKGILEGLPAKPDAEKRVTKKELIMALAPDLRAKLAEGYSVEELIEILEQKGVSVKATTLTTYLRHAEMAEQKQKAPE